MNRFLPKIRSIPNSFPGFPSAKLRLLAIFLSILLSPTLSTLAAPAPPAAPAVPQRVTVSALELLATATLQGHNQWLISITFTNHTGRTLTLDPFFALIPMVCAGSQPLTGRYMESDPRRLPRLKELLTIPPGGSKTATKRMDLYEDQDGKVTVKVHNELGTWWEFLDLPQDATTISLSFLYNEEEEMTLMTELIGDKGYGKLTGANWIFLELIHPLLEKKSP